MQNETLNEQLQELKANTAHLKPNDVTFANSLLDYASKKGYLSDKQLYWVNTLNARAIEAAAPAVPAEIINVGAFQPVVNMITQAASPKLKNPKVRLLLEGGEKIVLSVAKENSKVPGSINITDGGPFGNNIWYGRVEVDGTWTPSKAGKEVQTSMIAILQALATDPVGVACEYGKLSGHCCFCGKSLTDISSVFNGFGARCAENFKLTYIKMK